MEERFSKGSNESGQSGIRAGAEIQHPAIIGQIVSSEQARIDLKNSELNRVLGGGMVPGSLVLIGGEPGIGKSTLLLQVALECTHLKTLYVSGEESGQQIKLRAERIGASHDNCLILTETLSTRIIQEWAACKPDVLIVDSVQTLQSPLIESVAGSISQIRQCTAELMKYAKESATPVFLVGHITKDGQIAGPKLLEHMVDCVLQFEGDRNHVYRLLRAIKNRFGSTNELGIFEMVSHGLRCVENPSEILISSGEDALSGTAIAATMEGVRPMLIEVQALVSSAVYGTPQRQATGFDTRRLNMLLAVLEKRCGFKLALKDVFLNIAGGIRVDDPAIDLAVVASILSSAGDISIPTKMAFSGEVGLNGEIRPVARIEQRIREAEKMGFEQIFVSGRNKGLKPGDYAIKLVQVNKMEELFRQLFA